MCSDKDLVALAKGEASPQKMFMTGRLKVRGKLMVRCERDSAHGLLIIIAQVGLRMNDLLTQELGKMSKL